jgi:hypothetical protein
LWTEEVKSFIRLQNNHAAEYETCIDLPQSAEAMGSGLCEVAGN